MNTPISAPKAGPLHALTPWRAPGMLCVCCLVPSIAASLAAGNLSGTHLRITTVQENRFTQALDADGELLPPGNWTGMFPEMISWISVQAGFTYELLTPSGNGTACHPPGGGDRMLYLTQYGCAESDVTELGISDVYMGVFYVTECVPRSRSPDLWLAYALPPCCFSVADPDVRGPRLVPTGLGSARG